MLNATHIVYAGLGSPEPYETNGEIIQRKGKGGPCAHCGEPAWYRTDQAVSSNFCNVKNASRAWPFGGAEVCAACVMACKALRLRIAFWFARESGIWHVPTLPWIVKDADGVGHAIPGTRVETLDSLLNPPSVPFVAGWGRMGISKGGEQNLSRVYDPRRPMPPDPLVKLQSKHVAIYAEVAMDRDRYPLQVDDVHDVVVDVELWSACRSACYVILGELRGAGIGKQECVASLLSMRPPQGAPMALHRQWRDLTHPIEPHHHSLWWPLFVELLRMPALVLTEKQDPKEGTHHATTRKRDRSEDHREEHAQCPDAAGVSASVNVPAVPVREARKGPVQLRLF